MSKFKEREFIKCFNENCNCQMRYDPDDQQYSCGSCNAILKRVVTPNERVKNGYPAKNGVCFAGNNDPSCSECIAYHKAKLEKKGRKK